MAFVSCFSPVLAMQMTLWYVTVDSFEEFNARKKGSLLCVGMRTSTSLFDVAAPSSAPPRTA
eukprot:scaffold135567_cov24-Tisochrysis_lutea.AAC.1